MAKHSRSAGTTGGTVDTGSAGPTSPEAKQADSPAPPTRRSAITKFWALLGATAVGELAFVAASFLRPRRSDEADAAGIVVAGPLERFEPGSVTAFPAGKFYLARLPDGGFLALARECTHLGCTVPWVAEQSRFICPCHASAFDITGAVLSSPAPRPLDTFAVRIENGIVKVDSRTRVRRGVFEGSQVVSP